MVDMGLYLMIFDSSIHRKEVVVARATPPQPSSKDHEVENSRAESKGRAGIREPVDKMLYTKSRHKYSRGVRL